MLDLSGLNREQLEAVLTTEGPLLVLAGAGSGKTRVITFRLARLVQNGVDPKAILCVTFTNKAATEMKHRARGLAGKSVRGATISTFHALGARILRAHPDAVGLRQGFTITDGSEQLGTMRRILRALRLDDRRFDPKRIMALISHAKNAGMDAAKFRAVDGELADLPESAQEDEDYQLATIEVYEKYEQALLAQNVVDFDDLLLLTLKLLTTQTDVRARLQARWRYLMVDEYQDTNGAQLDLLRQLAGPNPNLCVVGDDDQSIYGWRGADVRNILGFDQHFAGAKRVMLLTNYRSTGHILDVANAIIEQNPGRYDKRLIAAADQGERVRVSAVEDEETEAEQVAVRIFALLEEGVSPGDVAVLYRSNVQSRPIELGLRTHQVPYRVVGGMDLFDRREIKDALSYLRVLHNPEEEQALRRIVNWPPRGIGDTTLRKVDGYARDHQLGLLEAIGQADAVPGLSARSIEACLELSGTFRDMRKALKRRKPSTVAKKLLEAAGVEKALLASSDDAGTAERRVENVRALVRQLERFEQRVRKEKERAALEAKLEAGAEPGTETPDRSEASGLDWDLEGDEDLAPEVEAGSLEGFLADLALSGFDDTKSNEDKEDKVVLSTIHAAKGLEWPHVFLVGWEEELLPHKRTIDDEREIAEERRLAYVAVTRAKAHCTITWAKNRARYGQIVERTRSRFLDGLPEEHVEMLEDRVRPPATEEEEIASAEVWLARIKSKLG